MGSAIFNALIKVISANPQLLEDVISQAFIWGASELKKANAKNAA